MRIVETKNILLFAALIIAAATTLAALPNESQNNNLQAKRQKINDNKKEADDYLGPVVDYDADHRISALTSRDERALREARDRRYNREAPQPLGQLPPNWEDFSIHNHWQIGLPSLPVVKSDAVVRGHVVDAQAHLSNDKTGVYSEFTIQMDEILKDSSSLPLTSSGLIIAEREGGVVRFQDGRLLRFTIDDQGMPRIGRQYVLFLNRNEQGEDYHILTGYELRESKVFPLDIGEQFISYKGFDTSDFLNKVRETIQASRLPREREGEK